MFFVSLLLSGVFLSIYSFGISGSVFGGDSGDIILSYFFGSLAHPPGYPLNTILGWLVTRFSISPDFAFRANFASALYFAVAIGLLFYFCNKLVKNVILALAAAATLGFVPLFWLYAHVAEVFQLTIVLILISLIFLFDWWKFQKKKAFSFKPLYFSVFFWGLASFHHQTAVLLAPAFMYALWKSRSLFKKRLSTIFKLFLAFSGGFIPYLYAFFGAASNSPTSWYGSTSLNDFFRLISRADYGTFTASSSYVGFSLQARMFQLLWYFRVLKADFTSIGIVLAVLGALWLFLKKRDLFWFFLLAVFFTGPFFQFYASFPLTDSFLLGVSERFFLTSYIFVTIFLAFGMLGVASIAAYLLSKFIKNKRLVLAVISSMFLLLPFVFAIINWEKADLSKYKIGETVGADILSSANPPGIVFLAGDTLTFNTQYSYWVEGISRDSEIILTGRLRLPAYRNLLAKQYAFLNFPDDFLSQKISTTADNMVNLISVNYPKTPIYSIEAISTPSGYRWVQQGMLKRLYKESEVPRAKVLAITIERNFNKLTFSKSTISNQYIHFFADNLISYYSQMFEQSGHELLSRGLDSEALKYFQKALDINQDNTRAMFGLGEVYYDFKKCQNSLNYFNKAYELDKTYWQALVGAAQVSKECFKNNAKSQEYLNKAREIQQGPKIPL